MAQTQSIWPTVHGLLTWRLSGSKYMVQPTVHVCLHNKTQWMSEAGIFQFTAIVEPLWTHYKPISWSCWCCIHVFFLLRAPRKGKEKLNDSSVVLREQLLGYNKRTTSGFISRIFFITTFSLLHAICFASSSRLRPCRTKYLYLNCCSVLPLALVDRQASGLTD